MAKPWWKGTFAQRMAHRAARRAEAALFASASASHSRACSKAVRIGAPQPVFAYHSGNTTREERRAVQRETKQPEKKPIDYEEYLTRLADRREADPRYQQRLAARRKRQREFRDKIRFATELERANIDIAEDFERWAETGYNRLQTIWTGILNVESEDRWRTSPTLSQKSRIALTPRIHGCGAAAKRAGFAA